MILESFSREDLLKTFHRIASVLEDRAHGYYSHNEKSIVNRLRVSGEYKRVFSCEVDKQRYYEVFNFGLARKDEVGINRMSILTVFNDVKGQFVIIHNPNPCYSDDMYISSSWELRLFTAHFVERFYERTGRDGTGCSLIDKTIFILSKMQNLCASTVDDTVIRRYGEPALRFRFLQEGVKETECAYINDGDVAIVERYGLVPVWRTYISKEMLFDSQIEFVDKPEIQEGIQMAKSISAKLNGEC